MKTKYLLTIVSIIIIIIFLSSCKEEQIVESKKGDTKTFSKVLAKENISLAIVSDSLSKKEKIAKLKREHERPYVVIDKPEKLLAEKLKYRPTGKSLSKSSNNLGSYSAQSIQSCYTLEIDVWAFEKYHPISGLIVGILPKGSFNYPDNLYWQYNQNILSILKNTYAFSKIIMESAAINANTVFQANEIIAGIDGCNISAVSQFCNNYSGQPLWGMYTDEPFSRDENPMPDGYTARNYLNASKLIWKEKFGQNSNFIVGETTTSYTSEIVSVSDYVNCSWYGDPLNFWPFTKDQRNRWTDFNNSFGAKFNHLWISGELDRGEMDQLIGHAQNMGKNSIWLYAGELGISDQSYWDAIGENNYYAFMHGYINREERKFIYVYSYIGNGDPCSDPQITSWDLIDIIDTGETRVLSH